eukprot:scaffold20053_cov84-Isochrysis_galbana.AAC.1
MAAALQDGTREVMLWRAGGVQVRASPPPNAHENRRWGVSRVRHAAAWDAMFARVKACRSPHSQRERGAVECRIATPCEPLATPPA